MALVHIDDELHALVKGLVEKERFEYPTVKYIINKAVKEFLERRGYKVDQSQTPNPAFDAYPKAEVEG